MPLFGQSEIQLLGLLPVEAPDSFDWSVSPVPPAEVPSPSAVCSAGSVVVVGVALADSVAVGVVTDGSLTGDENSGSTSSMLSGGVLTADEGKSIFVVELSVATSSFGLGSSPEGLGVASAVSSPVGISGGSGGVGLLRDEASDVVGSAQGGVPHPVLTGGPPTPYGPGMAVPNGRLAGLSVIALMRLSNPVGMAMAILAPSSFGSGE